MIQVESEVESPPSAAIPAAIATILILIFYLRLSPAGPWSEPKFTNGVVGVSALCALYLSWYRLTFRRKGVLIPVRELSFPKSAGIKTAVFSFCCIISAYVFGGDTLLPGASGLVVLVIGLLALLQSLYLFTITAPPSSSEKV